MSDYGKYKLYLKKEHINSIDDIVRDNPKYKSRSQFVTYAIDRELRLRLGLRYLKK